MGFSCVKKKIPPMWFILDEPNHGKQAARQGPYDRKTFVQLMSQGRVQSKQLIWTSERIFPNASKPRSSKLIRISNWRRLDEFPDPILRQLQQEAQLIAQLSIQPMQNVTIPDDIPPIPQISQQQPPPGPGQYNPAQQPPMQEGQGDYPYQPQQPQQQLPPQYHYGGGPPQSQ